MNHLRKTKAMKLIGDEKDLEKVADLLQSEFTPQEIQEVLQSLSEDGGGDQNQSGQKGAEEDSKKPFSKLTKTDNGYDVSQFKYSGAFRGKEFREYLALTGDNNFVEIDEETGSEKKIIPKLSVTNRYRFAEYKAKPIFKDRFPGIPNSPKDFVGIDILSEIPTKTTVLTLADVLILNAQITNPHSRAGHGRYLLLAK
ncbi:MULTISPECIES: hypothetical protein [unclassified Paraflavitalea]|uniref:hypothetical protein n=1 Tax=unclassified Paraflavitalea TaxID=2798305 RepID=UPI003D32C5FC